MEIDGESPASALLQCVVIEDPGMNRRFFLERVVTPRIISRVLTFKRALRMNLFVLLFLFLFYISFSLDQLQ